MAAAAATADGVDSDERGSDIGATSEYSRIYAAHRAFCSLVPTPRVVELIKEGLAGDVGDPPVTAGDDAGDDDAGPAWLSVEAQDAVLRALLDAPPCNKYPPPAEYTARLAKRYATEIERCNMEFSDRLLEALAKSGSMGTGVLAPRVDDDDDNDGAGDSADDEGDGGDGDGDGDDLGVAALPPDTGYASFFVADDPARAVSVRLIMETRFQALGMRLWGATFTLSEWAVANAERCLAGHDVVELGSGVGLAGLIMARHCAGVRSITMTDYLDDVVLNILHNARQNGGAGDARVDAEVLDWKDVPDDEDDDDAGPANWPPFLRRATVLVGSDLVYDEGATRLLVAALAALLATPAEAAPGAAGAG
eukprot:CAMPEP_0203812202 /NCGR_PEP_ID=MMETSP0115-20131106/4015_1 /ASSEMBLY_ACC=CAM_ASM_000227 /TAXON_ID=33651 /ORGANISM="Bicosoecid sp, Strain ms1" /LENGTH=364 /DNA_ID=CAMNT_0050721041 /DNA_START=56 /DNA_END=1146 /DNA_ORIENTATION=+